MKWFLIWRSWCSAAIESRGKPPRFKKALYHFLRENHKFNHFDQGDILHVACSCWPHISIDLIQLLLDLGADPNSISAKGNTPLHLLAMINCESWSTTITEAVQKLLDFRGSYIDQSNRFGRTALNMLKNRQRQLSRQAFADLKLGSLTINSRRVLPLSCLCLPKSYAKIKSLLRTVKSRLLCTRSFANIKRIC